MANGVGERLREKQRRREEKMRVIEQSIRYYFSLTFIIALCFRVMSTLISFH